MSVIRILGIDPGSRLTGYGCIDLIGSQLRHVISGTLRLSNTGGKAVIPLEERLLLIHEGISHIIQTYKPTVMSVERVFFAKNAVSALKLGQARGAVILSGAIHGLDIVEYSPSEVKATIVGHGQADKEQVAKMVQILIGKREFATADASDGLALAICHAYSLFGSRGRPQQPQNTMATRGKKNMSLAECVGISPEMVGAPKRRIER